MRVGLPGAALAGVLLVGLSGCSWFCGETLLSPEMAISGLNMRPGSGMSQAALIELTITNPNNKALELDAFTYRIRLQGRDLASGTIRDHLSIPAAGSIRYSVPASINGLASFNFFRELASKPRAPVRYELEATVEPAGLFSMPLSVSKSDAIGNVP